MGLSHVDWKTEEEGAPYWQEIFQSPWLLLYGFSANQVWLYELGKGRINFFLIRHRSCSYKPFPGVKFLPTARHGYYLYNIYTTTSECAVLYTVLVLAKGPCSQGAYNPGSEKNAEAGGIKGEWVVLHIFKVCWSGFWGGIWWMRDSEVEICSWVPLWVCT